MSADIIDAAVSTDLEIKAALLRLRQNREARIKKADTEIPILYAKIKGIEKYIVMYRQDRNWCVESLKTIDRRIAELTKS